MKIESHFSKQNHIYKLCNVCFHICVVLDFYIPDTEKQREARKRETERERML